MTGARTKGTFHCRARRSGFTNMVFSLYPVSTQSLRKKPGAGMIDPANAMCPDATALTHYDRRSSRRWTSTVAWTTCSDAGMRDL